ncbi:FAD:protein FMN transferase [Thalassotalea agarivorans]|uniref:FAD:protein FMN transferase n=2 Tax=Thalassotalea agarivorans TaxID=349064 RepID=A0A1H9YH43_THASX|nr:FAD:protein FMN transferase [Thalassotalea agarivorans]SES68344.1 thiamine biosynthesis lipoprotein [Thalassotalea agarivorans]
MGTTYNVKVIVDNDFDSAALQTKIDAALVQVNDEMSTYQQDSEITRFNQSQGKQPVAISAGFRTVLTEALKIAEQTNGKLDITVGPLVNLWGFGPDLQPERVPSEQDISIARERVGYNKVVLTEQGLSKTQPDIYIDLSTIAKGWGVDVVAMLIEAEGITDYLVEVGGEMRLSGFKATGELWHVAIEKPVTTERAVHQIIVPKNNSVATSGDYRNYIEVDGKRYSHIIDPDTAYPIEHRLVSVTVIHPSSMISDGLSTAIMVMGPELGLAFAEEHELAALMIVKTDTGFEEIVTKSFMQYLK